MWLIKDLPEVYFSSPEKQHHNNQLKMHLKIRDLPALVTARTTSTTSTTSNSSTSSTHATSSPSTNTISSSISRITSSISSTSTSSSVQSSSSVSTSVVHATVMIPNQQNRPYVNSYSSTIDGTVFIACGSVVGFILVLIFMIWSIINLRSKYTANKQRKEMNMRDKLYNQSPSGIFDQQWSEDTLSSSSSSSDISEKFISSNDNNSNNNNNNNNSRDDLFVSPTEALFFQDNNNSSIDLESDIRFPPQSTQNSTPVQSHKFRPPSVHLDQLLNQ